MEGISWLQSTLRLGRLLGVQRDLIQLPVTSDWRCTGTHDAQENEYAVHRILSILVCRGLKAFGVFSVMCIGHFLTLYQPCDSGQTTTGSTMK